MEIAEQTPAWRERIAGAVRYLAGFEQTPMPLKHYFAPGIYIREIFMPAGTIVVGKIHKTEHFNIILQGRCALIDETGPYKVLAAPLTFISKPGVQKALYIYEDCIWQTVHLTNERNMEALEAEIIEPDPSYPILDRTEERLGIEAAAREETLQLEHKS